MRRGRGKREGTEEGEQREGKIGRGTEGGEGEGVGKGARREGRKERREGEW